MTDTTNKAMTLEQVRDELCTQIEIEGHAPVSEFYEKIVRAIDAHISAQREHHDPMFNDEELPGMWSYSDFTGGDPDERSYAERQSNHETQREGEAVAWMYPEGGIIVLTANKHIALQRMRHGIKVTPLYKEPPRPRVEVTDDGVYRAMDAQIKRVAEGNCTPFDSMRAALEAVLSEKCHGT
jgi:hypothetical protein